MNKKMALRILIPFLLFFIPSSGEMKKEGYLITLQIETTADWTNVNFTNLSFDYVSDTLLYPPKDKGEDKVWLGILEVRKPPYDSTLTRAELQILFPKDLPPTIEFFIRKGGIGYTRVRFFNQQRELLTEFINYENRFGDPANRKDFSFASTLLKRVALAEYPKPKRGSATDPLVLAFYYLWWGDNWFSKDRPVVTHQPQLGFYSSSDEKVLARHIAMAKKAGIDGFICSWWGKGGYTDQNLLRLARQCEESGFKFTILLEEVKHTADLREQLDYILSVYTKSEAFLKYQDRPVIFIYSRILDSIPLDSLRSVVKDYDLAAINYGYAPSALNGFFGFYEYLPPCDFSVAALPHDVSVIRQRYLLASAIARRKQKIVALPVMPGFDDRALRKGVNFLEREEGEYYSRVWEAVLESEPDWVLITSFNEWFEGTEIEPSKEYGDFYLRLTRFYSQLFKKGK